MKELQKRVAFNGLVRGDYKVFAAGPITLQPASRPYRIVMCKWGDDKISVHTEYFEGIKEEQVKDLAFDCSEAKSFLEGGHYFKPQEIAIAQRIFADKLEHHCRFVESVLRETVG